MTTATLNKKCAQYLKLKTQAAKLEKQISALSVDLRIELEKPRSIETSKYIASLNTFNREIFNRALFNEKYGENKFSLVSVVSEVNTLRVEVK